MNLRSLAQQARHKFATSATARASWFLVVASMVGHVGNYLYYVVSARAVGPADFAEVSALAGGVGMIALLPFTGVQAAIARELARLQALGEHDRIDALVRRVVLGIAVLCAAVLCVLAVATPLAISWLNLSGSSMWLVTVGYIALGIVLVVLLGVAQGLRRFRTVGVILGGPMGSLRPLLVLPFVAVAGATGAMWALLVAAAAGLVLLAWVVAPHLKRVTATVARLPRLWTTFVALLAFASLTSLDAVVAKIALPAHDAGLYNSAALLGKIAFYGPSALSLVLLPLVTARLERGQPVRRLIALTLAIVVGMGLTVSATLFLAPPELVTMVFGAEYLPAYSLAAPYALIMTVYAVLYVHLTIALAAAQPAFIRILVGATALQLLLFALLHSSWWQLLTATAITAATAFVAHEATSPAGMIRLWRRTETPTER